MLFSWTSMRMSAMNRFNSCAAVLASFIVGTSAWATLPTATVSGGVFFNFGGSRDLAGLGTVSFSEPRASFGLTAQGEPYPALMASAVVDANNSENLFGRSSGTISYAFQVAGPAGPVSVSVSANGFANASASSGATFVHQSSWSLAEALSPTTVLADNSITTPQLSGSFDQAFGDTVELILTSNHIYVVSMAIDVQGAATAFGSKVVRQALVDPTFSLGSGVDPADYIFEFSAGIGNTSPVPEPISSVLLCLGLILFRIRRLGVRDVRPSVMISAAAPSCFRPHGSHGVRFPFLP